MNTYPKKLLVLIGEYALEKYLIRDAKRFGAHGYTISDVRGGGAHGTRDADWEGNRSIRMEIICDPNVAEGISRHVLENYCANYAVSMFVTDVGVLRPERF